MKDDGTLVEDKAHKQAIPSAFPNLPKPAESDQFIDVLKVMGTLMAIVALTWAVACLAAS